jgi:hypothetical protein
MVMLATALVQEPDGDMHAARDEQLPRKFLTTSNDRGACRSWQQLPSRSVGYSKWTDTMRWAWTASRYARSIVGNNVDNSASWQA